MCGEQPDLHTLANQELGSPPRVRGTAVAPTKITFSYGITPACAGNRYIDWRCRRLLWDHPRVCGEQQLLMPMPLIPSGSPPRVRGTGFCPGRWQQVARITPACAGNSIFSPPSNPYQRDHPRVCGEQLAWALRARAVRGSPPRVRGTDSAKSARSSYDRITPACAGNSLTKEPRKPRLGDHPRVCGEQPVFSICKI